MNDEAVNLLFKSLSYILDNQIKIMKHLGILNLNSEYGDPTIEEISNNCYSLSRNYEHNDGL